MSEPRIHGHAHLWLCTSTLPCEFGAPHVCALPSVEELAKALDRVDNACGDPACCSHIDADYLSREDGYRSLARAILAALREKR